MGFSLGRALRGVRSNPARSVWNAPALAGPDTLVVTSSAFEPGGRIPPERHRGPGAGDNVSPSLAWTPPPPATGQLLVLIEDVDVPLPRPLIHTAALLPAGATELAEGGLAADAAGVRYLSPGFGRIGYQGPRPVPGHGEHRYGFMVFAVDHALDEVTSLKALLALEPGHVLARGRLVGIDER